MATKEFKSLMKIKITVKYVLWVTLSENDKKEFKKSLAICLVAYQMLNDYKTIKTSYGNETHNEN